MSVELYQLLFGIALSLVATFGGLWVRSVQKDGSEAKTAAAKAQEAADSTWRELQSLRATAAADYVRRDDLVLSEDRVIDQLKVLAGKVDRLAEQLASKKDRHE